MCWNSIEEKKNMEEVFITVVQNAREAFVHRLALAFRRVGNFLTGRAPGSGGTACDGAPIVKMGLPLLPVVGVWVCGADVPNDPVGVEGMPPP